MAAAIVTLDDCSEFETTQERAWSAPSLVYHCPECSIERNVPIYHNVPDTDPDEVFRAFRALSAVELDQNTTGR